MAATATQVALEIVSRPFDTIKELALCPEQDMDDIRKWSEPIPSWREECVHEVISRRCAEKPEALAVSAWDGELMYQELERLSSNLAAQLTGQGVRMETFVALCMEKSKWTIVAILAVLKAGGAYVLLDPSWPLSRMQTMCEDLHVRSVLTSPELSQTAKNLTAQVIMVPEDAAVLHDSHVPRHPPISDPRNALYAVFTSGSTGKPKGIVVEHGAFCSRAMTTGRSVGIERHSRVLQFAGYAFDVVNRDILFTLMLGACVCVPAETDRVNHLERFMTDHRVSWASITPSVADLLDPAKVPDLKTLVLVGEAMSPATLTTWANRVQLVNGYGPAECVTICSVRSGLTANSDPRNIGRGVGSLLWIVDPQNHNRLMPVGAVGELLVAGVAVGRGYLNDLERTNAAFLQNTTWLPKVCPAFRGRLYKTGDLAQYTGDEEGTIRFLGRKDNQVKIHGQRLELGEVEHHIRNCLGHDSDLSRVVVDLISLPAGDSTAADDRKLAAFLSPGGGKQAETVGDDIRALLGPLDRASGYLKTLESYLAALVPGYMIPTLVIPIWHIPLNPSGKTDRKALRQVAVEMQPDEVAQCMGSSVSSEEGNEDNKDYDETKEERDLRKQWSRVLNVAEASIGRHDHFFRRGGDSIAVMKLARSAGEVGMSLTFADVFANPTLAAQAEMVATATGASSSSTSIGTTNSTAASSRGSDIDDEIPPFALIPEPAKKREALQVLAAEECGLSPSQIEDIYPTTPMQEGLLALTAVQQGAYISRRVYHVREGVSLTGLEAAWKATLDANPPLRTRIIQDPDGDTFQVVVRGGREETTVMPIHKDLDEYLRHDENQSMSLGQPLARLAVAARRMPAPGQSKMVCVLTMHHSIFDAWSVLLILEQVEAAYSGARLAHRPFSPFIDYIAQSAAASKDYWGAKLSNLEAVQFPALPSPTYTPAATRSTSIQVALPSPSPSSSFTVTLSNRIRLAWALTLASYTGLNDVVFGVTVSGRGASVPGIEHIAGATLATYPQRVQVRPSASIGDELQAIQGDSIATVPFEQFGLQYISRLGEEPARACRFQSLLVVQQQEEEKEVGSGILHADPDLMASRPEARMH